MRFRHIFRYVVFHPKHTLDLRRSADRPSFQYIALPTSFASVCNVVDPNLNHNTLFGVNEEPKTWDLETNLQCNQRHETLDFCTFKDRHGQLRILTLAGDDTEGRLSSPLTL